MDTAYKTTYFPLRPTTPPCPNDSSARRQSRGWSGFAGHDRERGSPAAMFLRIDVDALDKPERDERGTFHHPGILLFCDRCKNVTTNKVAWWAEKDYS